MQKEVIGIIVLMVVAIVLIYPYQVRFYFERTLIAFGFCPRCKKFSMQRIKDYSVCTICRKR